MAGLFGNFIDVKNFRAEENRGAELVTKKEQALTRIPHLPFDREFQQLSGDGVYLRIWSPRVKAKLDVKAPIAVAIQKIPVYSPPARPARVKLFLTSHWPSRKVPTNEFMRCRWI